MRKHLAILLAALLAVAIAAPAFADVEFKYGGQFRARFQAENNVFDGTDKPNFPWAGAYNGNDNRAYFDQRLRLYFSFIASKNLQVVAKFEMGDTDWGFGNSVNGVRASHNSGGNVGADTVGIEMKNIYMQFNIPQTPSTAILGIQNIALMDSWIIDDDVSGAVLATSLDPFKITLGYIAPQKGWERSGVPGAIGDTDLRFASWHLDVDDMFVNVEYKQGPFKGGLVFFWQDGHQTVISADPSTLNTPVNGTFAQSSPFFNGLAAAANAINTTIAYVDANNLYDIGFNFSYKIDWLNAYINFVKNFGSIDFKNDGFHVLPANFNGRTSFDYTGWMVDAGVTYFCAPFTVNIGGFYTSGYDFSSRPLNGNYSTFGNLNVSSIQTFVYPMASNNKYFSEIIGGGVLADDLWVTRGFGTGVAASNVGSHAGTLTPYWEGGYGFPTNLWTITVGGSWQAAAKTKVSASYWYFGTSSAVPVSVNSTSTAFNMGNSIGHEIDLYVDQGITDGLTLTLVGAYMLADDAFCPVPANITLGNVDSIPFINKNYASDAFKVGARLQWNW